MIQAGDETFGWHYTYLNKMITYKENRVKKKSIIYVSLIFVLAICVNTIYAETNLSGTWEGPTYVEGPGIELVLTLELKHEDGKFSGIMNDDLGYIDSEITEASFKENVLTFTVNVQPPEGDVPMIFKLKFENDTLEGNWSAGDGLYEGNWKAEKK